MQIVGSDVAPDPPGPDGPLKGLEMVKKSEAAAVVAVEAAVEEVILVKMALKGAPVRPVGTPAGNNEKVKESWSDDRVRMERLSKVGVTVDGEFFPSFSKAFDERAAGMGSFARLRKLIRAGKSFTDDLGRVWAPAN